MSIGGLAVLLDFGTVLPSYRIGIAAVALSSVWFVSIVAAPYLAAHTGSNTVLFRATTGIYLVGSVICHQRSDRSFHTGKIQWPVCARCTGFYAGAPLGAALVVVGRRRLLAVRHAPAPHARLMVGVAAVPTILTLAFEWLGASPSSGMRALAAVPLSSVVVWLVLDALSPDDTPLKTPGSPF